MAIQRVDFKSRAGPGLDVVADFAVIVLLVVLLGLICVLRFQSPRPVSEKGAETKDGRSRGLT